MLLLSFSCPVLITPAFVPVSSTAANCNSTENNNKNSKKPEHPHSNCGCGEELCDILTQHRKHIGTIFILIIFPQIKNPSNSKCTYSACFPYSQLNPTFNEIIKKKQKTNTEPVVQPFFQVVAFLFKQRSINAWRMQMWALSMARHSVTAVDGSRQKQWLLQENDGLGISSPINNLACWGQSLHGHILFEPVKDY